MTYVPGMLSGDGRWGKSSYVNNFRLGLSYSKCFFTCFPEPFHPSYSQDTTFPQQTPDHGSHASNSIRPHHRTTHHLPFLHPHILLSRIHHLLYPLPCRAIQISHAFLVRFSYVSSTKSYRPASCALVVNGFAGDPLFDCERDSGS